MRVGWALLALVVATAADVTVAALIGPWRQLVAALVVLLVVTWLVVAYRLAD